MASPARAPEQIIREWLDRNGTTRVGLEALEQTWGIDSLGASDRRRIAEALDRAGVEIDPPLRRATRSEKVTLSVRGPEPKRTTAPAPTPGASQAPAPPTARGRAGRRARALLARAEPPAKSPPPVPTSPAREEALRADAAREQARAVRGRERREREEAAAQARAEVERTRAEEEARAGEQAGADAQRKRATAEAEYQRDRKRARARAAEQAPATPEPARAEPEPDADEAPAEPVPRRTAGLIGAGVALMVLGSLGPWAKAVFVTDYGIDRSGLVVIAAAVFAGAALFLHLRRGRDSWLPLLTAAAGAFAAALVAGDFRDLVDDSFVSPTWGLYMAFLGSVMVVGISMALLVRRR